MLRICVDMRDSQSGPLKLAFTSDERLGGFSKGDLCAWVIAMSLWITISGGFFDDDSAIDFWISSIVGFGIIVVVLYPSFVIHNWSNEKPLFTGEILRNESLIEFLHFSIKKEPDLVLWKKKKSLIVMSVSVIFWIIWNLIGVMIPAEILIAFGVGVDFSYELALALSQISFLALFLSLIGISMGLEKVFSLFKIGTPWMNVAWLVLIVMSIDLVIESSFFALTEIIGVVDEEESYWFDPGSVNNAVIYSLAVVNMVILAPILEEVIFRGYVLDTCRGLFQEREAVIISSLLFGLVHFSYGSIGIILISIGGGLYAWIRLRTDSLIPAIICHSLWNGITVIVFGIV